MGPALFENASSKFLLNSKSLTNSSPISAMLICPLNPKFGQLETILFGMFFELSGKHLCLFQKFSPLLSSVMRIPGTHSVPTSDKQTSNKVAYQCRCRAAMIWICPCLDSAGPTCMSILPRTLNWLQTSKPPCNPYSGHTKIFGGGGGGSGSHP